MYGAKERGGGRFRIAETRRPARQPDAESVLRDAAPASTAF
jgi:hypothetical protein